MQARRPDGSHESDTQRPARARRWLGALGCGLVLLLGGTLLLHGCTLPVPAASAANAAVPAASLTPAGEPQVIFLPATVTYAPTHAPTDTPASLTAVPAASVTPTTAPTTTQVRAALGLANAAAVAATAAAEQPPARFPTATPTPRGAAAARAPVSPLPVSTLAITAVLGLPVPGALDSPAGQPAEQPAEQAAETPAGQPAAQPAAPIQPTPDGTARTAHVPILMYHYISTPPADADIYRRDLSVPPELFAAHLDRIQAEGYTTISLYDLIANLTEGAPLPDKPVIITFDDGYRDIYDNALPLLRDRGMVATVFVITDFMDEGRPEYLTWEMARALRDAGISVESHGRNHVSLTGKDDDYLIWQALGSAQTIAFELGAPPRFVSYPAGDFDQRTIDIFRSANYWAGVTTEQGATHSSDDPFRLTRVRVRGTTATDDLAALLAADW